MLTLSSHLIPIGVLREKDDCYLCFGDKEAGAQRGCGSLPKVTQLISDQALASTLISLAL